MNIDSIKKYRISLVNPDKPWHSGAFTWGKVTFALKYYISFIYKQIFTNEGLKFLGRIVLDETL